MNPIPRQYRRLDDWVRNRSRLGYASLVGTVSAASYLLVGTLFGDRVVVPAVAMGLTLGALYYASNPNESD
ncbi:hypothetical protein [Halobaculum limi]|uniref:hypothetical protein n=1 Tax=Halobaculum limi TaxID=3031916 RepID=UPI002406D9A6|nr:hypothetical protein [Halobaculum sp. YSMS11]